MIWAPISELDFIGKSPVYAATFVAFLCFSILAATARTWTALLVLRFLQAFFGSPCLAIGGASMHDLFADLTVPYPLAIWIAAAYCGPALGPLIASYVVPEKGWRWGLWEVVWLAAPTLVFVLLIPETFGPTIRARSLKTPPTACNKTLRPTLQSRRAKFQAIIQALQDAIVKPVQITLLDPAVAVANLYTSFMYGTYYTFFDAIPRVYPVNYAFTTGQLGLAFLCIFIACVVGGVAYGIYIKYVFNVGVSQGRLRSHEERLRPALVACILPPIGLFLFGWTSDGTTHWVVSLLGVTIYAIGTYVILQCLSVYLPRIYPSYAASLFAANDLCRSLVATACVHAGAPLYDNLGIGPGVSVLGAMSVLGIPGIWFIYYKGPALRAKSRFVK